MFRSQMHEGLKLVQVVESLVTQIFVILCPHFVIHLSKLKECNVLCPFLVLYKRVSIRMPGYSY
jgi:hypothetical protein